MTAPETVLLATMRRIIPEGPKMLVGLTESCGHREAIYEGSVLSYEAFYATESEPVNDNETLFGIN